MAAQCYNRGCGKTFEPAENADDACCYHPGSAIFHDALKGWSCCNKRTCDFSEFLGIPGCALGRHSSEKPVEQEEDAGLAGLVSGDEVKAGEVKAAHGGDAQMPAPRKELIFRGPPPAKNKPPRPSGDSPLCALPVSVSASLQRALDARDDALQTQTPAGNGDGGTAPVASGTSCKNSGCRATYKDESSNTEPCTHHAGVPVFHEGMKFWSCCERKTTDFSNFLVQPGCSIGVHRWAEATQGQRRAECRYDWHQTGRDVVLSVYARHAQPALCGARANHTTLELNLVFEDGKEFTRRFLLYGTIAVEYSAMAMAATKVEVTLRKADAYHWANLEHPSANQTAAGAGQPSNQTQEPAPPPAVRPSGPPPWQYAATPAAAAAPGNERRRGDDTDDDDDDARDDESLGLSDGYDSEWEREFGDAEPTAVAPGDAASAGVANGDAAAVAPGDAGTNATAVAAAVAPGDAATGAPADGAARDLEPDPSDLPDLESQF